MAGASSAVEGLPAHRARVLHRRAPQPSRTQRHAPAVAPPAAAAPRGSGGDNQGNTRRMELTAASGAPAEAPRRGGHAAASKAEGDAAAAPSAAGGAEGSRLASEAALLRERPVTLALLTATLVFSYMDRQVLASLFEPIKSDLKLSDAELGLLGGVAVALFGACFGVHIARLADRRPRRATVLAACFLVWSVATAAGGAARSFGALLSARIAVGVGEAGAIPISLALLADAYPQAQRSRAMSVYYTGASPFAFALRLASRAQARRVASQASRAASCSACSWAAG